MQHANPGLHQSIRSSRLTSHRLGHAPVPSSAFRPSIRGSSRLLVRAAQEAPAADSQDGEDAPAARRVRRRLFKGGSSKSASSSGSSTTSAPGSQQQSANRGSSTLVDDFASAFESLAVAPKSSSQASGRPTGSSTRTPSSIRRPARERSYDDSRNSDGNNWGGDDSSYLDTEAPRRPPSYRRYDGDGDGSRRGGSGLYGRSSGSKSYGSVTKQDGDWKGRGKQSKGGKGGKGWTLEDFEDADIDNLSPEKQEILAQLQQEADKAEHRRLAAKARSERIPEQPKKKQDPVIFQALTRQWDEKMSHEELRGARAAARKVARVGLYDRNRALKAVRRKALQVVQQKPVEELTEEERIIALRAQEIRDAAAAKSIQPTKETLAQEAMGVPRSYARAEALPAGLWEELKNKYRSEVVQIKIGRRGAAPSLVSAVQTAWRGTEVVKLRIHDDKSSRKMNLPRMNLLLRELEELTGGVLLEASGSSIWLYRGVDWQPPPPPPVYKPPPAEEMLQQQYTPKGSWQDIGGVVCYVTSSSSSSSSVVPGAGDKMTVLMLADHFPLADSKALLQVADRVASKGALVVLADLLGAPAKHPNNNIKKGGEASASDAGTNYWYMHRWPLVTKRKLEYMSWYQTGPGSWQMLRPVLLQLLEAMAQQGLYSPDAPAPTPTAAAAAADAASAAGSTPAGAEASSSSSSEQQQRPLGLWGIGWGSFILLQAAGDDAVIAAGAKALVAVSPATYNKDYDIARALQLPVALLPAKYDTMDQVMAFINLLAKPWEQRCLFKRYGKVKPGWANWLPQWQDPRAMRQVAEQLLTSVSWLRRELLGECDGWELPEPLLTASAGGAASAAALEAAVKKAAKSAAAEQEEAEAGAGAADSDGSE